MLNNRKIKLSATSIACWLQQNCMRRTVYDTYTEEFIKGQGILKNFQINPRFAQTRVQKLLFQRGRDFESEIYENLITRAKSDPNFEVVYKKTSDGFGHISSSEIEAILRKPPQITTAFLQADIPIGKTFHEKYINPPDQSIFQTTIAHLDILIWDASDHLWKICDIKNSQAATNRHRYQVAFYKMVITAWIDELNLSGSSFVDKIGFLWVNQPDVQFPGDPFNINPYSAHVQMALKEILPNALKLPIDHLNWHLVYSCESCPYYLFCKEEAKQKRLISLIPMLTKPTKQYFNDRDIFTIDQAEKSLQDPRFGEDCLTLNLEREHIKTRITVVQNLLANKEPLMKFLRKACPIMPRHFGDLVPIFFSSNFENLYGYTYSISLLYYDRDNTLGYLPSSVRNLPLKSGQPSKYFFGSWLMQNPSDDEQVRILIDFLETLTGLLRTVATLKKSSHIFVLDRVDVKNLYDASLKWSSNNSRLQVLLQELLQFFPPTEQYLDEKADPRSIWQVPFTPLSEVLRRTVVLPVGMVAHFIQDVWHNASGDAVIKVRRPLSKYLREMSNQIALTFVADFWQLKKKKKKTVTLDPQIIETVLQWKVQVIKSIYWELHQLNDPQHNPSIFKLSKFPVRPPRPLVVATTNLNKLAEEIITNLPSDTFIRPLNYFVSIESLMTQLNYFVTISNDLYERDALGAVLSGLILVDAEPPPPRNRGFILKMRTTGPASYKLKLEVGKRCILTEESFADKLYTVARRDLSLYSVKIFRAPIVEPSGEIILYLKVSNKHPFFSDVVVKRPDVKLEQKHMVARYALDEEFIDITGIMMGGFLKSFAFLRLANNLPRQINALISPNTAQVLQPIDAITTNSIEIDTWENNSRMSKLSNFNPAQKAAVNSTFLNELTLVWGPPGTGKTRVIAWAIVINLWSKTISPNVSKEPMKIGITAFTHRAIDNALEKLCEAFESFLKVNKSFNCPRIFRARSKKKIEEWTYNPSEGRFSTVELDPKKGFDTYYLAVLSRDPIIVAGTVWQLNHLNEKESHLIEAYQRLKDGSKRGTTWFKSPNPIFDMLIIDEASQLKVGEFFMATFTMKDECKLLVVGDDKQLPPVITSSYPDEFQNHIGSIYTYLKESLQSKPVMLNQTYRFPPDIASFPSDAYYKGDLKSKVQLDAHLKLSSGDIKPVIWEFLDPSRPTVLFNYDGPLRAKDNEYEAELVAILSKIIQVYLVNDKGQPMNDNEFISEGLGIITPHNAQINAIRTALNKFKIPRKRQPAIDTVDRFQGQEREIVIVSYGVSDPDYAEKEADFILSPNRFNVSITRPKTKYIVIMSNRLLYMLPEDEDLLPAALQLRDFAKHFKNEKSITVSLSKGDLKGIIRY